MDEGVGIVAYNPHFKGAITLLRMRGQEQFSTIHGVEMFDFIMQIVVSGLIVMSEPVRSLHELSGPNTHLTHLSLMTRCANMS